VVFGPSVMNAASQDVDVTTLPFDGTYTLLVEGRFYTSGAASYAFNVGEVPRSEPIEIVFGTQPRVPTCCRPTWL
jgi:large repetitive protein